MPRISFDVSEELNRNLNTIIAKKGLKKKELLVKLVEDFLKKEGY